MWIGIRQGRLLPRIAGVSLQFLAGASFIVHLIDHPIYKSTLFLNNTFLGAVMVSAAALFCGAYLYRSRETLYKLESYIHWVLGA